MPVNRDDASIGRFNQKTARVAQVEEIRSSNLSEDGIFSYVTRTDKTFSLLTRYSTPISHSVAKGFVVPGQSVKPALARSETDVMNGPIEIEPLIGRYIQAAKWVIGAMHDAFGESNLIEAWQAHRLPAAGTVELPVAIDAAKSGENMNDPALLAAASGAQRAALAGAAAVEARRERIGRWGRRAK